MTSKERVMKALKREKADRPACDLRCTPEVWEALYRHFNAEKTEDVLDKLDVDMRWITAGSLPFIGPRERSTPTLGGEGTDIFGCVMKAAKNKYNTYYEFSEHPLANCKTAEEVYEYSWPSLDWWDYSEIKGIIKAHKKTDDRAIMFFAGGTFETPWYMRGMEQFLVDLYENPDIVNAICTKVGEYYYQRALRVIDAAEGEIDIKDLIDDEEITITLTHFGYIKRLPLDTYKSQRRGGRGISALTVREEDFVKHLITTRTHNRLLFFTKI